MQEFLKTVIKDEKFEVLIDVNIFPKDIILKAAYTFLDKGYFFFKQDSENNIILQFTKKDEINESSETIIASFMSGLLDTYLRDKLEKDNRVIRETIVTKAINGPLDTNNFISLDTVVNKQETNQIDFDKDIDDILKEIENDPELKIDEEEIEKILKEIEEETGEENKKPAIAIDLDAIKKAKEQFKK